MNRILRNSYFVEYGVSCCFLLIHVAMLILFNYYGVTPMVYFNLFSIAFYIATAFLIKFKKMWVYSILVYLEVVAHMALAVIMVGSEAGFQVTLIGMCTLAFYGEYLSVSRKAKYLSGIALSVIGMAAYLGSYIYSKQVTPPYDLPDQTDFWLQITWGVLVFIINGALLKTFVAITTRSERFLSDLAEHDPLTGLYNRAGYEKRLEYSDVSKTTLLIADVDHFKEVNDTYGHEVGDRILKKFADAFMASFRLDDYLCRIGGDEFAAIMTSDEKISEDLIKTRVDKINSVLADTTDGFPEASISAGTAYGFEADDTKTLFENADKALYHTKENGRRGCSIYHG